MKLLFLGRKDHAAAMIEWLIDKGIEIVGVVPGSGADLLLKVSRENNLPVYSLAEAEIMVRDDQSFTDLVVSYLFDQKIREPLISTPKYGCINFHPAILPDWKGTAGYNVAILHKLKKWGATAHFVDQGIDSGPIIKVSTFDFDYRCETAWSLELKTRAVLGDLFKSVLSTIMVGVRPEAREQDKEGTYISRKQMELMKKIDIEKDDIDLKIRAFWFPPHTGAYLEIKGVRYTLVNDNLLKMVAADLIKFE